MGKYLYRSCIYWHWKSSLHESESLPQTVVFQWENNSVSRVKKGGFFYRWEAFINRTFWYGKISKFLHLSAASLLEPDTSFTFLFLQFRTVIFMRTSDSETWQNYMSISFLSNTSRELIHISTLKLLLRKPFFAKSSVEEAMTHAARRSLKKRYELSAISSFLAYVSFN